MPSRATIYRLASFALTAACVDSSSPTHPDIPLATARGEPGRPVAVVRMNDACDPITFAGVPGGCQRSGGMTQDQFIAQLTQLQRVPAWNFNPPDLFLRAGNEYLAVNAGGEVHTFTEVEEFGGGIVGFLNDLAGVPAVAPECEVLGPGDFIPAGGSSPTSEAEPGDEKYQCCIHPWMRTTVHTRTN